MRTIIAGGLIVGLIATTAGVGAQVPGGAGLASDPMSLLNRLYPDGFVLDGAPAGGDVQAVAMALAREATVAEPAAAAEPADQPAEPSTTATATLASAGEAAPEPREPAPTLISAANPAVDVALLRPVARPGVAAAPAIPTAVTTLPTDLQTAVRSVVQEGARSVVRPGARPEPFPASDPEPININRAPARALEEKLNIDARRARFIIEFREVYGSFRRPEDLAQVNGITDAMIRQWEERGLIVLD